MNIGFSGGGRLEEQALQDTFENAAIAFVPMADPDCEMMAPEGAESPEESDLKSIAAFIAREQFNLLLDYRFGGFDGAQSLAVSAPERYRVETEEERKIFRKLSDSLA